MTSVLNRQTRKRLATRQRISDVATRLFIERGFDKVKVEEIADAADVSRMTVFNHFPRKEDMFFDLDEEGRAELLSSLQKESRGRLPWKPCDCSPIGLSPISVLMFASLKKAATSSWLRFRKVKHSKPGLERSVTS